ncbi:CPBP family intramembrane glutamic endopeptidase [Massilibacterium senegalense]|uniref:CPBP family intramembrane glutamic endopeptidase n=1 Tax=Massilibacterium senegalense TaxID=1632858 RepID=UPI002D79DC68|nr:CPBP family intramembrane glutamic endopeptidase [Massilibacterium senegalense]
MSKRAGCPSSCKTAFTSSSVYSSGNISSIFFAGFFYALLMLKTNSIFPAIIFHFVINIGMVFSGLIF